MGSCEMSGLLLVEFSKHCEDADVEIRIAVCQAMAKLNPAKISPLRGLQFIGAWQVLTWRRVPEYTPHAGHESLAADQYALSTEEVGN